MQRGEFRTMDQKYRVTDVPYPSGSEIELPVARVIDGSMVFERLGGMAEALDIGAFLVAVPEGWDMTPGLELCRSYYKPQRFPGDRYRGHRDEDHPDSSLGYADRPDQVEQLQIESQHWNTYLPEEVVELLRRMKQLTSDVLSACFRAAGVPEKDWPLITGDQQEKTGWCHTTVNHYRAGLGGRHGIVQHTDSGFITLIYADRGGLEVLHNGQWRRVRYRPDCFTVNFGAAAGILTDRLPSPMTAVIHQVPEIPEDNDGHDDDRSSFTVFLGPRYDMDIYQYSADGTLQEFMNFRDFSLLKAADQGYEFHPRL
ncbi:2OG-Fe(II) oxygenase family protein [Streptomyces ossamyceticus]|uniref:2OG-Fe(II) oxygenase family protein n=1 Tax=Streptomyces ossamyceticus TaxID=249581 RepID=UPI0006E22EAD|nr:2OG-Fe(II) oxygenase family protein [Streptomyces ossamyceticus]